MSKEMIALLDALYVEFPFLMSGPAPASELEKIKEFAGFALPLSYLDFVARYGGAIVGPYPIYGSGAALEVMDPKQGSVIDVTNRYRADEWPGSENSLVIGTDGSGNAFMLGEDGKIVCFDHDFGGTYIDAPNFDRFIIDFCLKAG